MHPRRWFHSGLDHWFLVANGQTRAAASGCSHKYVRRYKTRQDGLLRLERGSDGRRDSETDVAWPLASPFGRLGSDTSTQLAQVGQTPAAAAINGCAGHRLFLSGCESLITTTYIQLGWTRH